MSASLTQIEVKKLLVRLARLRWENNSWDQCAETLKMTAAELENLTAEHSDEWRLARSDARLEFVDACLAEGVHALKKQMRESRDPKHQREAAKALAQLMIKASPRLTQKNEPAKEQPKQTQTNPRFPELRTLEPLNRPAQGVTRKTLEQELWETAQVMLTETGKDKHRVADSKFPF